MPRAVGVGALPPHTAVSGDVMGERALKPLSVPTSTRASGDSFRHVPRSRNCTNGHARFRQVK